MTRAPQDAGDIRVRMYRQGLGDCFLITYAPASGRAFTIMIDCGVILGTEDSAGKLRAVVQDVIATTGGRVDLLVVTHEHYDHVAAFVLAPELFATQGAPTAGRLAFGEIWFAWTEDPENDLANRLRQSRADRLSALTGLIKRVEGMAADAPRVAEALRFFGVGKGGAGLGDTAQAMANAAGFAPAGKVAYRRPGESVTVSGAPGLRFFVLGPPQDEAALKRTDSKTEVYHLDEADLEDSVLRATGGPGPEDRDAYAPFEGFRTFLLSDVIAGRQSGPVADFIAARYLGPTAPTPETDLSWRRIDGDWLAGADQLALALDSATNNTSLVLAIELVGSGKVLLFPADAQVGNWLSWQSVRFGDAADAVTGPDLLARTVFYKVGHHGSHNATLKAKGLERMTSPDLVAFIPVDKAMAVKKRWLEMPLDELVRTLTAQCGGRVVRIDEDKPAGFDAVSEGPPGGPFGALWFEWRLTL